MSGQWIWALVAMLATPLLGGFLAGVDRKLTARLQGRFGPPLWQPFADVLKLLTKGDVSVNVWPGICAQLTLASVLAAGLTLALGGDLLVIFFLLTAGSVFTVIGALAVPSPFSQVGGHRELLLMLMAEPILLLVLVSLYTVTGSFSVEAVFSHGRPIFLQLPLAFLALTLVLTIKMRKSPFDLSASHHGHQELVQGVMTEYSGLWLGLMELAHFAEITVLLFLCGLFWATDPLGFIGLMLIAYLAEIGLDNITARLTWRWLLPRTLVLGLGLVMINLAALAWIR